MRYTVSGIFSCLLIAGTAYAEPPAVNASYEVKVNLDPERAPVILADLVHGIAAKPRSVYYYQIAPTPQSDKTIVRARRDAKNKVDIDVKLRGIQEVLAWLLTGPQLNLEGVECEWDIGLAADNTGNLSCDIKVETPNDLSDLDGASVMARLNDSQRRLFEIGTHHPDFLSSLNACEKIATKVYKGYAIVPGCDEATVEVWPLGENAPTIYELSCKTTTLEAARVGLQAEMDRVNIVAAEDQRGKTAQALEQCGVQ